LETIELLLSARLSQAGRNLDSSEAENVPSVTSNQSDSRTIRSKSQKAASTSSSVQPKASTSKSQSESHKEQVNIAADWADDLDATGSESGEAGEGGGSDNSEADPDYSA
jgi:hypothetical protein